MGEVQAELERIACRRIRQAAEQLADEGRQEVHLETLATRAAIEASFADQMLARMDVDTIEITQRANGRASARRHGADV